MSTLFARLNGVTCRSCGAQDAAPTVKTRTRNLCGSCNNRYSSYLKNAERQHSDNDLNGWIARQLFLSARRLQQFGVTGRCEAVTLGAGALYATSHSPSTGYQCARPATMLRDGRRACWSHGKKSNEVLYVDGKGAEDVYREFARLIAEISLADEQFFKAAQEAISNVLALKATPCVSSDERGGAR